jgi:MFS family permease
MSNSLQKESLFRILHTLPGEFWLLNVLQMLERTAYWSVLLQMSVYTAQKDIAGGLGWEQSLKGIIFFVWAMVQNLTPFFLGGLADKFGRKKLLILSLALIIISYLILGTQTAFIPFLTGVLLLGFASGLFKPALQGALAVTMNCKNSSTAWGIYFMLLNLAVLAAPPLSKFLKEFSWTAVFFGSAAIMLLNLIVAFSPKADKPGIQINNIFTPVKTAVREFIKPEVYVFIFAMSGFAFVYMQFYETFQNFIVDWSDTTQFVVYLPQWMTMETTRGIMISYEWIYTINSIFIVLFVVLMSWLTDFMMKIHAIMLGILLAAAGIGIAGSSMNGSLLIIGFIIYTFGEMITNPKFNDYLSSMAPATEKSMYMGYLNLAMAIGLGGGALLGGYLYENIGEKSALALRYISEHSININNISAGNAVTYLADKLHLTHRQVTTLLWDNYEPWTIWLPFIVIAILSIFCLIWYAAKYYRDK